MNQIRGEQDLDHLRRSVYAYGAIAAWNGAGIFEVLSDGGARTLSELPGDLRALENTVTILAHLGLIARDGAHIRLTGTAMGLLEAGVLRGLNSAVAFDDFSRLDGVIKEGGAVKDSDGGSRVSEGGVREEEPERARAFMDMLYRRSAESAGWTAASIARRLPQAGHALDLGGGHGRYAEALVSKGFKATLFDRSVCVAMARERYGEKIDTIVGDFMADALGGPYDVILLSNIVHGLGRDENRRLLLRLREVLQPGGHVVVKDMFLDRTRSHPEAAAFFGMTMQMYTREGRCYSVDDWALLWQETGFATAGVEDVPDLRYSLVFGRRD